MHRFTRAYSRSVTSSGPGQVQEGENGDLEMVTPLRTKTQADQDKEDDVARRKALKDLVQSWQDRLQLITLITTFLASVEASMLQVTTSSDSAWSRASNAGFMASLVLHLWASFVSFFASFFLVRFKVQEAKREERQVEAANPSSMQHVPTTKGSAILDAAAHTLTHSPKTASPKSTMSARNGNASENGYATLTNEKTPPPLARSSPIPNPIWSANPQLVQCGPFQRQPPVNLLSRCHTLCLIATALGFILAMVGVLCYAWAAQARSVAIITTVSIGLCLLSCIFIITPQSNQPSERLFTYDQ
ncbi:hypothetical protein GYMLUDRAFT_37707 [Collybiopsis luxurians FD-317 M1]|nr:hypothetical protein GYMLUDRAFT_37707 [Collybiopsis luxurians FD-317 M1]